MESRWGRWGAEDERGALNYIDQQAVLRGVQCVTEGKTFPLGIPIRRSAPFVGNAFRSRSIHLMRVDGGDYDEDAKDGSVSTADDYIFLSTHGTTHVDALCHAWSDGQLYNGFSARTVRSSGARRLGAHQIGPIVTRGVLLDIARLLEVPHLQAGFVISPAHVADAMSRQGVKQIKSGDAVLFRTGWVGHYNDMSPETFEGPRPGIGRGVAQWLVDNEVSIVGADNPSVEVSPSEDGTIMPLHLELLRNQGIPLLELLDLETIGDARISTFLFSCSPLPVVGGTAGPVAPVAVS